MGLNPRIGVNTEYQNIIVVHGQTTPKVRASHRMNAITNT